MIILPRRSRRKDRKRQQFAGIVAAIAALVAAGMPALTRTFRAYPRGSLRGMQNTVPWTILGYAGVVLVAVIFVILRFVRRGDDESHDDADAGAAAGEGEDGCEADVGSKRLIAVAVAIAIAILAFGAAYYARAS
ncbi:MAG: hypothetical protein ACHQQ3_00410 [Gemmatimonadales bacterium]